MDSELLNDIVNRLGDMGGTSDPGGAPAPVVRAVLETNLLPPIPLDVSADAEGSVLGPLMALIRPRVRGSLLSLSNFDYAPYGAPTPGVGTVVFIGVLAIFAYGVYRLARR